MQELFIWKELAVIHGLKIIKYQNICLIKFLGALLCNRCFVYVC